MKKLTLALLGCAFLSLSACEEFEEAERQRVAKLEASSCPTLAALVQVKTEEIKRQRTSAGLNAFSSLLGGKNADVKDAELRADIASTRASNLQREIDEIRVIQAKKGCR